MDRRTAIRTLAAATALPLASTDELAALFDARRTLLCDVSSEALAATALDAHQLQLVKTVADIILPPTDSPGASDVGVHEFIDIIVSEWFDTDEQERFLFGLADLDSTAVSLHGSPFLDLESGQRVALVAQLDNELMELRESDRDPGQSFFHWMKRLTLTGYFTSEEGMAAIQHRRIPGAFEGCRVPEPAR